MLLGKIEIENENCEIVKIVALHPCTSPDSREGRNHSAGTIPRPWERRKMCAKVVAESQVLWIRIRSRIGSDPHHIAGSPAGPDRYQFQAH